MIIESSEFSVERLRRIRPEGGSFMMVTRTEGRIMRKHMAAIALLLALPVFTTAGDHVVPVYVGDPSPVIPDIRWVGGDEIRAWEPGHVYVVDFWATWCPPCIKGLRHLQTLHEELSGRNVHIVAIAVWPNPASKPPEDVLAGMPELGFSLAIDRADAAANAFLTSTRSSGLPNTMIVDRQGRLAWVGAPSMGFEAALRSVIAGTWDMDKNRQADRVRHQADVFIGKAAQAERSGEFHTAIDLIERAVAVDPARFSIYRGWQYEIALVRLEDGEQAREIADRLVSGPQGDDHYALFILATRIVINYGETPEELRDLDLALRCAEGAIHNNPKAEYDYLALLANVHALREEYGAAAEAQRTALEVVPESGKASAEQTLEEYRARSAER
jgi:thiol-disulfide isomerase/thioredoxin